MSVEAYIKIFYGPDNEITDMDERHEDALKRSKLKWSLKVAEEVNEKSVEHFRRLHSRKFQSWVSGSRGYDNLMARVRTPINETQMEDDKAMRAFSLIPKCFEEAEKMREKLEKLEQEIFGSEEVAKKINTIMTAEALLKITG